MDIKEIKRLAVIAYGESVNDLTNEQLKQLIDDGTLQTIVNLYNAGVRVPNTPEFRLTNLLSACCDNQTDTHDCLDSSDCHKCMAQWLLKNGVKL